MSYATNPNEAVADAAHVARVVSGLAQQVTAFASGRALAGSQSDMVLAWECAAEMCTAARDAYFCAGDVGARAALPVWDATATVDLDEAVDRANAVLNAALQRLENLAERGGRWKLLAAIANNV